MKYFNFRFPAYSGNIAVRIAVLLTVLLTIATQMTMPRPVDAVSTTPTTMNFQGRLTNSSGNIMSDGLYNMKFRIYDASTGGTLKWSEVRETTNRVQLTNGLFSVQLGQVTPLDPSIFASGSLYFEIELPTPATATCSTASCGTFTEGPMTPRNKLSTSAYAYNSETLDGLDSSQFARTDAANTFSGTQIIRTDSANALQVQDAAGAKTVFSVDTFDDKVRIGGGLDVGREMFALADTTYALAGTTFAPVTLSGAATALALGDDEMSAAITLPFQFSFYNKKYTSVYVDSNGSLTFDGGAVSEYGQALPYEYASNVIAGYWNDLDPSLGGTIKYETTGTAPNRVEVIAFSNVPVFGNPAITVSFQIQLYEGTNNIEIHTTSAANEPGGFSTQGIQADLGQVATFDPSRNNVEFSLTNDAVRFTYATPPRVTLSTGDVGIAGNLTLAERRIGTQDGNFIGVDGKLNTYLGINNLKSNDTGWYNTALGFNALHSNTAGYSNIAIGADSLYANTTGSYNIAQGGFSLYANTSGSNNIALGQSSLQANTTGSNNIALGGSSLTSSTTGNNNLATGYNSLHSNTTGYSNTGSGSYSLSNNTTGYMNAALGINSLSGNTTGFANTAAGTWAGYQDAFGYFQTTSNLQRATAIGAYSQVQKDDSLILGSVDNATQVVVGATVPIGTNRFGVSPLDYQEGTATRTFGSTALLGTDTSWTAAMVGDIIIFEDGTTNTVAAVTDATHITMGTTYSGTTDASPIHYRFHITGLQVKADGGTYVGNTGTEAFRVQNAAGTKAFLNVDTIAGVVKTESLQALTTGTRTLNQVLTTVDGGWTEVGATSSIALGLDGYPRISYSDYSGLDLKFAVCSDADCTTKTITTVDSTGSVGDHSSVAIASDGFARISYYDSTNQDLKFVQCTNAACTTKNITSVDTGGGVGAYTSLALGSDGFARISYYDQSNADLKFVQCTNAACTTKNITTVDSTGELAVNGTSLALGSDGFARISYYDQANSDLKFAQCTNAACTTKTITTVDSAGVVGLTSSIALGSDGFGRIVYFDQTNESQKFVQCTNAACTTKNVNVIDTNVSSGSAIALGSDGLARIAYLGTDTATGAQAAVRLVRCADVACSSSLVSTVDYYGSDYSISLALGSDGNARIAYQSFDSRDLKLARLLSSGGGVAYTGSTLGGQASRYGQLYATTADFLGNVTIQGTASLAEYALNIQGGSRFINTKDEAGKKIFTVDGGTMYFSSRTGNSYLEVADKTGMYVGGYGDGSPAIQIEKYGTGDGLFVTKGTGEAGYIIHAQSDWSNDVFTVGTDGSTMFRAQTNSATGFQVQNSANTAIFNVDTTIGKVTTADLAVGADKSLTLTGGTTRPSSPVEGMMFYDTTAKQLLVYANGKWQADRSTAMRIVAASNSPQAVKDGADYIADGTGDQTEINAALTAAAGGKVYLAEGTYTINASISMPNNTALVGSGKGTIITLPNSVGSDVYMIVNTDTVTGTGLTIRDLRIDGNGTNQATNYFEAISLNHVGSATADGAAISGVWIDNMMATNGGFAIGFTSSRQSTVSNVNVTKTKGGIYFDSSSYITVSSSMFRESRSAGEVYSTSSAITIANNSIYHASSPVPAIRVEGTLNTVSGNTIIGTGGAGISLLTSATKNTVIGNTISGLGKGINIENSTGNSIISNRVSDGTDTGGGAISLYNSSSNLLSNNHITDTAGATYAIDITDAASTSNTLAGNIYSGTGASSIHDLGTGTVYANQLNASGILTNSASAIKSSAATAFQIQNAGATETLLGADASANRIKIGNSTAAAAGDVTLLVLDNVVSTITPTGVAGSMYYDSTNNKFKCYTTSWVDCDTGGAGSGANTSLSNLASTNINAALNATSNNLTLQTTTSGNIVLNSAGTIELQDDTNIAGNVTLGAAKTLTLTGGATASRPASPTNGMMYYDTDTKQLLVYAGTSPTGKWQADRSTATKIVAASNSSQALKDSADYVADGDTATTADGDQVQINAALTAAAGGKVYLAEGTYTIDASISMPDDTGLIGSGPGAIITIPNSFNTNIAMIKNANGTASTGWIVRDVIVDGNSTNNTLGTQSGADIYTTGSTTKITFTGVTFRNLRNYGLMGDGVAESTFTGNTFSNTGSEGLFLMGAGVRGDGNNVSGNLFRSAGATTSKTSLYFETSYTRVTNNQIFSSGGSGIANGVTSATRNVVANNIIKDGANSGIYLFSSDSIIESNILENNTGAGANSSIDIGSNNITIANNRITDTAGTGYAIALQSGITGTYLSNNTYSGTGATAINDLGTGTIYANQLDSSGQLVNSKMTINSSAATAFQVQNTAASETFVTADASTNRVKLGNNTAAAGANVTVLVLDNAASTTTPTGVAGAMYYDSTNSKFKCYTASWVDCDTTGASGVTGVGAFSNTSIANGASVAGSTITFGAADATNPGMLSTGAQTIAGAKTFKNAMVLQPTTDVNNTLEVNASGGTDVLTVDTETATDPMKVQIGSSASIDGTQINLSLDSSNTYADSGTCGTTTNQGSLYYNTNTNAIRACVQGYWEDIMTTAGMGLLTFGIVPDSGTGAGDLLSVTGITNGPCKVSFLTTTTVKIVQGCTVYSGGRKVVVPDNTTPTGTLTFSNNNFVHVCLTGTGGQPAFSASGAESANLPAFSVNAPVVCLADIKTTASALANIYDTRTYTTNVKTFATLNATTGVNGALVTQSATQGVVQLASAIAQVNVRGVVVATAGSVASNNTVNMIIATQGTQPVKATGTSAVNSYVQGTATAGYTSTTTVSTNAYGNAGIALRTIDTSCTSASTALATCQYSQIVDLKPR